MCLALAYAKSRDGNCGGEMINMNHLGKCVFWLAMLTEASLYPQTINAQSFDVISVHLHKADDFSVDSVDRDDRYAEHGITVLRLLQFAYNLRQENQIVGLPGSLNKNRFDIDATIEPATISSETRMTPDERREQRRLMVQSLLRTRFNLTAHLTEKEMQAYSLVVSKGGLKMKESTIDQSGARPPGWTPPGMINVRSFPSQTQLIGNGISIDKLANTLGSQLKLAITNKTDLNAKYDVSLRLANLDQSGAQPADEEVDSTLFGALENQLGLKLVPEKTLTKILVIDHVDMPSAN